MTLLMVSLAERAAICLGRTSSESFTFTFRDLLEHSKAKVHYGILVARVTAAAGRQAPSIPSADRGPQVALALQVTLSIVGPTGRLRASSLRCAANGPAPVASMRPARCMP